jgi:hypothetical protein
LRDSFTAPLGAITTKDVYGPVERPGPNTRLGLSAVCIWHVTDHYGQVVIYLRENGIVRTAKRKGERRLAFDFSVVQRCHPRRATPRRNDAEKRWEGASSRVVALWDMLLLVLQM